MARFECPAYARGVVSSRGIERLSREHVTFIALSGDTAPHFTTLTAFVSSLTEEVPRCSTCVTGKA